MATVFDEILTKGVRAGQIPARESQARDWYRDTAKSYGRINEGKLMKGDQDRLTARPLVFLLFFYLYVANTL